MIKNVFIIITPFQYAMMKTVFAEELLSKNTLILHSENVVLEPSINGKRELIDFTGFSVHHFKKTPFATIVDYRRRLKKIEHYLEGLLSQDFFEVSKIIIGTDKDNFTQLFLNKAYKKNNGTSQKLKLHAVEEGLGFYFKENFKDQCLKLIYKLLTPLLFFHSIEYHKLLATDRRIDVIHMRLPHLRPNKGQNKHVEFKEIETAKRNLKRPSSKNKILIFSFPDQDYGFTSDKKYHLFNSIISKLDSYEIIVKPHPRENLAVFKNLVKIKILPKASLAEELNYFEYDKIINFTSSVIIDILLHEYPPSEIYTIFMKNVEFSFFDDTNCIDIKNIESINFEA